MSTKLSVGIKALAVGINVLAICKQYYDLLNNH